MSQPLWIRAASDTSVGTATIAASTDELTISSHGLEDGQRVVVSALTGGAVGVLASGGVYWVVSAATNTFQVSLTQDGLPIEFASDGGADVNLFDPGYDAPELRRLFSGLLQIGRLTDVGPSHSDRFGAKAGVLVPPFSGDVINVSGTDWTTTDLVAVVYPGLSSDDGTYLVAHQADSGALDPADGTNDRIDGIDLQIQDDDEDSSGFRRARVVYTAGTPASSPAAPSVATNAIRLGTVLVSAGGSPAPSPTTTVPFTVARGGVLPIRDSDELPVANRYAGMTVWDRTRETLEVNTDGSGTWAVVGPRFRDYAEDTDGASTTSEVYTGISVTVPSDQNPSGARFMVRACGHLSSTVADDSGDLKVRRGTSTGDSTVLAARRHGLTSSAGEISGWRVDDPPSGAVTYGLFIARAAGTGTVSMSSASGFQGRLSVEHWDDAGT